MVVNGARPRVALVVPHGVAARNFLLTGFLDDLSAGADVAVVHGLGGELPAMMSRGGDSAAWLELPAVSEGILAYILRKGAGFGHMHVGGTEGMVHTLRHWRPRGRPSRRRLLDEVAWWFGRGLLGHSMLRSASTIFLRLQGRGQSSREFEELFRSFAPDVVLCCDQRSVENAPAVAAARRMGKPVGVFVFSWDNLSSKARMPCDFDFYCVWSELMKEEVLRFYPFISGDRIHVTGTPQFEPYLNPSFRLSREDFFARIGADPSRLLLCFTGEDPRSNPENPDHLAILCEMVRDGRVREDPQVLVRPAPTDPGDGWTEVRRRFPEVIWCPPSWVQLAGRGRLHSVPTPEDLIFLSNLVRHGDCCVNMMSTMTLDFAIGGKPTVNYAFDISDPPPHGVPIWEKYFRYDHYRPVIEFGAALIAHSPEELAVHVNTVLENPDVTRSAREQLIRLEVGDSLGSANRRLAMALLHEASCRGQECGGDLTAGSHGGASAALTRLAKHNLL